MRGRRLDPWDILVYDLDIQEVGIASLYIKDAETNALAERLAGRRGLTKTAAVKLALVHELERDAGEPVAQPSVREVMERHWQRFPPPPTDAAIADKAFYDWLNDE